MTDALLSALNKAHTPVRIPIREEVVVREKVVVKEEIRVVDCIECPTCRAIRHKTAIKLQDIKLATAAYFGIRPDALNSRMRAFALSRSRHIAFYLCREVTLKSFPEIGRAFGGMDHTSVMYGEEKVRSAIKSDWELAYDVAQIEATL